MFDFLYNSDDKLGMEKQHTIFNKEYKLYGWPFPFKIQGRGKNGFALEPQLLSGTSFREQDQAYNFLPFLEVNVKVKVKMRGMDNPIVLSRNYLPDIMDYGDGSEFAKSRRHSRPYQSKMSGHTDLYDYQMKRISDIIVRYGLSEASEIPLSKVTSDYVAKDGDVLTGTLGKNVKISIADGATVTLKDATINGVNSDSYRWAGITCEGELQSSSRATTL